ncbi:MAG: type VII toxin-antitoxin system HepT family RNase toxin [bacterium]
MADPERYGSAERFLQLSIEALSDMASHLIAERNLGLVQQSRDLPRLLREHGYIDQALEGRWIRMIGFRNVLVHDYLEVVSYIACCKKTWAISERWQPYSRVSLN